jgi:UDP-glucuronate 4-epimerase
MQTVLITGGAGFIGSSLAGKMIERGDKVVVVDNFDDFYDPLVKKRNVEEYLNKTNFCLVKADVLDANMMETIFEKNHFDLVVHLAAKAGVRPSFVDPISYQKTNCEGTNIILECARKYKVKKIILASSSSVYGNNSEVPFKETDCTDFAISPYAATKKANEVLAYVYRDVYDLDIISLRFFTVYGPRQRPDLAINKFTRLIEEKKPIDLFGDGSTYRDYTYIDDICDGIFGAINYLRKNNGIYEIVNLGSNHPITLLELVKTIEKSLGIKAEINFLPMQPGDVKATYADISKARRLFAYEPHTSFEAGIKEFIFWKHSLEEPKK